MTRLKKDITARELKAVMTNRCPACYHPEAPVINEILTRGKTPEGRPVTVQELSRVYRIKVQALNRHSTLCIGGLKDQVQKAMVGATEVGLVLDTYMRVDDVLKMVERQMEKLVGLEDAVAGTGEMVKLIPGLTKLLELRGHLRKELAFAPEGATPLGAPGGGAASGGGAHTNNFSVAMMMPTGLPAGQAALALPALPSLPALGAAEVREKIIDIEEDLKGVGK